MTIPDRPAFGAADRRDIAEALRIAALEGEAILADAGTGDPALAYGIMFGRAQHYLARLAALAGRLAGEEMARLDAYRENSGEESDD